MSEWVIYGKRPGDKKYAALDSAGHKVRNLNKAMSYASQDDAQEIIDLVMRNNPDLPNSFQIRKAR